MSIQRSVGKGEYGLCLRALYLSHGLLMGFLGNGAFIAPLLANASHWFDRRRGIAIALVASGQNLAGALWPPVLRYLTDSYGWRQAFAIYAWSRWRLCCRSAW